MFAMLRHESPAFRDDVIVTKTRYEKACELGDGVACVHELEPRAGSDGRSMTPPASRATIERACLAGQGKSCVGASMIATLVDHDPTAHRRWSKLAVDGMEAACFAGDPAECELVAGFAPMSGVRLEPMRYRLWLETGCRGDAVDTCKSLATSSSQLPRDRRRELLQRACDGERQDACFALVEPPFADPSIDAKTRDAILARGLQLARAQCDLGDASACAALAEKLSLPFVTEAVQRDLTAYLEPSCKDNLIVCVALARSLARGNVALRDPARIARLEAEACQRGYPFTCRDPLGVLGVYPTLHASFLDTRSNLEWAPLDAREIALADAEKRCSALLLDGGTVFRLPTRAELGTLTEGGPGGSAGKLRIFARIWLPHAGALFASDLDESSVRLRFDAYTGDVFASDRPEGLAGCVRARDPKVPSGRPTLRLSKLGDGIGFVIADEKGKFKGRARAVTEGGLDAVMSQLGGARFDVDVDAECDWRVVTTFLAEVEKRRGRIGLILVRGEGPSVK